jgi:hypothetical protein
MVNGMVIQVTGSLMRGETEVHNRPTLAGYQVRQVDSAIVAENARG